MQFFKYLFRYNSKQIIPNPYTIVISKCLPLTYAMPYLYMIEHNKHLKDSLSVQHYVINDDNQFDTTKHSEINTYYISNLKKYHTFTEQDIYSDLFFNNLPKKELSSNFWFKPCIHIPIKKYSNWAEYLKATNTDIQEISLFELCSEIGNKEILSYILNQSVHMITDISQLLKTHTEKNLHITDEIKVFLNNKLIAEKDKYSLKNQIPK